MWLLIKSRETEVGSENAGSGSLNTRAGGFEGFAFCYLFRKQIGCL